MKEKINTLVAKYKPVAVFYWQRFYSNKKIILPITVALGLLFLTLIVGVIFGNKRSTDQLSVSQTLTPAPFIQPTTPASLDPLAELGQQINSLDLKQSKLSPPNIIWDIKF